jgi:hypothetical protein
MYPAGPPAREGFVEELEDPVADVPSTTTSTTEPRTTTTTEPTTTTTEGGGLFG